MTRRGWLWVALALAACAEPLAPVDPVWGKQPCGSCGMIVGDRRFAAQLVTAAGTRVHFDDLGCLVHYLADRRGKPAGAWVREAGGGRWLDARAARYAPSVARTPMDFGYEAREGEGLGFEAFSEDIQKKRSR